MPSGLRFFVRRGAPQLVLVAALVVAGPGCAVRRLRGPSSEPSPSEPATAALNPNPSQPAVPQPAGAELTREQAERYALQLINRDRASQGLGPVAWDETAAKAAQAHADDMVLHGYTAHWGTDGSVPEQRYSEVGGVHMVQENAGCFADAQPRPLDTRARFDPKAIEKVESAFFNEAPPHDGHRQNILRSWHTHVGIGLAKAKGLNIVCVTHEFVDQYGAYAPLPKQAHVGQKVRVEGTVASPARFVGVGLARVGLPQARSASELLQTNTYNIPKPYVTYFPKGYVTPMPVSLRANHFWIDVPLSEESRAGLYEVSVWAEVPGAKDFVMISLRTVRVQ